ncbi:hypothetical protein V502_04721 [Pseudogymnoascus sp. VKM F-4520 (FW-2644)]|nr:hypothetical protein V502_04721 [Pseudogymnoascus sp. VKM F-4520 (FW-2644)]
MANTTDSLTMVNNTEPPSTMETKTPPLTANVARILLLLRSLQRGRHNMDDPWIVLPLQLHEFGDLFARIEKNETLWGWVGDKAKFVYGSGDAAVSGSHAYYLRISYDSTTSKFVIRRPADVHRLMWDVEGEIRDKLRGLPRNDAQSGSFHYKIHSWRSATVLFDYTELDGSGRAVIRHDPDSQLAYEGSWRPTVVFEIAYSPGPKSLHRLAEDYIVESRGDICTVVGFELDVETKKAFVTVWRPHFFIDPETKLATVEARSETQAFRDEQGVPNPALGSGLCLTLCDFTSPQPRSDVEPDDASILLDSATLCKFLDDIDEWKRKSDAGELFVTSQQFSKKHRREATPEPVYEEDEFVFGEEELSVHERFLDRPVGTGKVAEGGEKGEAGEI